MTEIKVIQRHFGCISTSIDDGSKLSPGGKQAVIEGWKQAAQKIRVFGSPVAVSSGISVVRSATPVPSLKAMFEDYHLAIRGKGPLVLVNPTIGIKPACLQLMDYAESKNMGISWAFYAYDPIPIPEGNIPCVFGLTPPVVKILANETPADIYFEDGKWQDWMFKWIRKYMQAHRYFDATRFIQAERWHEIEESPVNVYEKLGLEVNPEEAPKKPRGRPRKSK